MVGRRGESLDAAVLMADFETPGQFYLGRPYDPDSGTTAADELLMYDSRDLTTHAVCVGMTGSGKTGLCLALLEEAAIDGIPALCIDPKGDLSNLMLTFPELRAEDFEPWVDPREASRQAQTVSEYAADVAERWRQGLEEWGQSGDRIRRLRDAADVAIYTPASRAGLPLTVLKSFDAPSAAVLSDPEALRERILSTVSGLLALLSIDADPVRSREHILLSAILDSAWQAGRSLDLGGLIRAIQSPPFERVGFLDLESFFPESDRFELALSLNSLVASPGFSAWLEGDPLDIRSLLYTPDGRPRLAILSIAHLSESERMFFVTIVLNEFLAWTRTQPGSASLRAILYMDEVFGYFPPTANPPSKRPMLTLLKQARAFGVGCVLATQNPVDLDYKGLANAGTWFLGRLQTERDKQRVLEGLEGASTQSGQAFDRQRTERLLAGLDSRVFLMNNVHDDAPVVFHTRWVLSWLRGPMTRAQIAALMADRRTAAADQSAPFQAPGAELHVDDRRPVLPPGIEEYFLPVKGPYEALIYRPALLGQARAHFVDRRSGIDHWDVVTLLRLAGDSVGESPWEDAEPQPQAQPLDLQPNPEDARAVFRDLPADMLQKKSYAGWRRRLKDFLYQQHRLRLLTCRELKESARPEESEADFRIRLRHVAREARDAEIDALRSKHVSRFTRLDDQIRRAEQQVEKQKSQRTEKGLSAAVSFGTSLLNAFFGRRRRSAISQAGTAIRSASRVSREQEDVRHAVEQLNALRDKREALTERIESEIQAIRDRLDPELMTYETRELTPRKSDIAVERVTLVWLPYRVTGGDTSEPAF